MAWFISIGVLCGALALRSVKGGKALLRAICIGGIFATGIYAVRFLDGVAPPHLLPLAQIAIAGACIIAVIAIVLH